jgi:hypothetical protein
VAAEWVGEPAAAARRAQELGGIHTSGIGSRESGGRKGCCIRTEMLWAWYVTRLSSTPDMTSAYKRRKQERGSFLT